MCRSGHEPSNPPPRRCPGCTGPLRNAVDRAAYSAKKVAGNLGARGGRVPVLAVIDPTDAELTVAKLLEAVDPAPAVTAAPQAVAVVGDDDEIVARDVTVGDLDAIDALLVAVLDDDDFDYYAEDEEDDDGEDWGSARAAAEPLASPAPENVLSEKRHQEWIGNVTEMFAEIRRVGTGLVLRGSWRRDDPGSEWQAFEPRAGTGVKRVTKNTASGVELDSGERLGLAKKEWRAENGLVIHETRLLKRAFAVELAGRDAEAEAADALRFKDARTESEAAVKGRAAVLQANDTAVVSATPLPKILAAYEASSHARVDAARQLLEAEAVGGVSEAEYRAQRDVRYPELLAAETATAEAWEERIEFGQRAAKTLAGKVLPGPQLDAELEAWADARRGVGVELKFLAERKERAEAMI